jgi:hypothetical protein
LINAILLKILTEHVRKEKYPVVAAFQLLEHYLLNRRRQDARDVKTSVQTWKLRSRSQLARVRTQGSSGWDLGRENRRRGSCQRPVSNVESLAPSLDFCFIPHSWSISLPPSLPLLFFVTFNVLIPRGIRKPSQLLFPS